MEETSLNPVEKPTDIRKTCIQFDNIKLKMPLLQVTLCTPPTPPYQKIHTKIQTSSTSECDCMWTQGLYRGYVKPRSSGWIPTHPVWCPCKKRRVCTHTGHAGVRRSQGRGWQSPTSRGERPGTDPSLTVLRRHQPC